jgi:hypothetical protein
MKLEKLIIPAAVVTAVYFLGRQFINNPVTAYQTPSGNTVEASQQTVRNVENVLTRQTERTNRTDIRQENKTDRVESRQEGKTDRTEIRWDNISKGIDSTGNVVMSVLNTSSDNRSKNVAARQSTLQTGISTAGAVMTKLSDNKTKTIKNIVDFAKDVTTANINKKIQPVKLGTTIQKAKPLLSKATSKIKNTVSNIFKRKK